MIKILTDEDLKKLSPEDKAFLAGFCAATDSAASLLYNLDVYQGNFDVDGVDINLVRFLENHEEVREALEVSLMHWMETEKMEYFTQMIENRVRNSRRTDLKAPRTAQKYRVDNYTKDKKQTK